MCEANISTPDQVVIFKGDCACLQAINLTNSTTGDLVFMGGKKFYPVHAESSWWNTLLLINLSSFKKFKTKNSQIVSFKVMLEFLFTINRIKIEGK